MDVMDAIRLRRSVRDYLAEPVARDVLRRLIDAAILAPNAMHEQPWRFTVVTDQALLDNISAKAKTHLLGSANALPQPERFRHTLGDPNFHIFYHAPALIVISAPAEIQWAVEDCALAAENLMLAARALNLGTCWIGFAQRWLNTPEGLAAIGLAKGQLAVAPIIVGHPRSAPVEVPHKEPPIHWID